MTEFVPINIESFNELYKINKNGEVYSNISKTTLKPDINAGYLRVCLYNGKLDKKKNVCIHKLMALTFLDEDKANNKEYVINHKDGNKLNNKLENLEIITYKENTNHAHQNNLINVHTKGIRQLTKGGELIKEFKSIEDACKELKIDGKHISEVCKGKRKTADGFRWEYLDESNNNLLDDFNISNFKQIKDFPNYYIDNSGKIYNIKSKKYLKPTLTADGYHKIKLVDNENSKNTYIHRLVAEYYVENQNLEKYDIVNHKDCNKINNYYENLEWIDNKGNSIHSKQNIKAGNYKKVGQFKDGKLIKEYNCIKDASVDNNIDASGISKCCKNKIDKFHGFSWKYLDEEENQKYLEPQKKPLINESGEKQCNKCHKYLELSQFSNNTSQCDSCKEKDKAYQKEKRAKAK